MTGSIVPQLRSKYSRVAKELLTPLLDLISQAERAFDGDLEKFHILLAVALRTAEHPDLATVPIAEGELPSELPSLWTNVHSISTSIGIPEETVRRKVRALVEQGLLERTDHSLRYTAKAAAALTPIREQLLRMAASNYRTVGRVLEARA